MLDPDPNPDFRHTNDGTVVLDVVGPNQMELVGVLLHVERASPPQSLPEAANGPLEKQQVPRVVQNLKSVEVIEVDPVHGFMKPHSD